MRPRQYLFGDWGGKRTALEEKVDFFYIADLEANPSGGLQQSKAGWERIRGTIDVNFDELMKWQGLPGGARRRLEARISGPNSRQAGNRGRAQRECNQSRRGGVGRCGTWSH
jgi:hypothetical protein